MMNKQTLFPAVLVVALSFSVAGCSAGAGEEKGNSELLPPVLAEVEDLQGATFELNDLQPLVVNAPDPVEWLGEVENPEVADFFPGFQEDDAVFNPGFEPRSPGSTGASLTSPLGETYDFTIIVK